MENQFHWEAMGDSAEHVSELPYRKFKEAGVFNLIPIHHWLRSTTESIIPWHRHSCSASPKESSDVESTMGLLKCSEKVSAEKVWAEH